MNYREAYETWLKEFAADQATVDELKAIAGDEKEIEDRFYTELSFGTAGMRGVLGAGTNRMNLYNVRRATKGFADYINGKSEEDRKRGVVIAYDSRRMSPEFAKAAGIKTGKVILLAQFVGGIFAGMGGAIEMVGMYKRFYWQSQVNYVWDGLLVHMLANENPVFIPLTAFFIAYLRIGAEIMSRATDLDNEIVAFLQCIVILLVGAERFLAVIKKRKEQKNALLQAQEASEKEV